MSGGDAGDQLPRMLETQEIDLPRRRQAEGDRDPHVMRPHQGSAALIAGAGAFGVLMTVIERDLRPRERVVAALGSAGVAAVGGYGMYAPQGLASIVRSMPAPVPPIASLIALAFSSAANSPMYFPAVTMTAVGASPLDFDRSKRFGEAIGVTYLGIVAVTSARRLGRDPQLWWNFGMFSAFRAAAAVGALTGRLALDVRSLERARQRDQDLIDRSTVPAGELGAFSAEARVVAAELDRLLLNAARRTFGDDTDTVRADLGAARNATHHFQLAPTLIAAAGQEKVALAESVEEVIETYRRHVLGEDAEIRLRCDLSAAAAVNARSAEAVLVTLKRALDNAVLSPGTVRRIDVRVLTDDVIRLEVEDDGGGRAPREGEWGTGLTESFARCDELDGHLSVGDGARGVLVRAAVPFVPPPAADEEAGRIVIERADGALDRIVVELRRATVWQGIACLACAGSWRRRAGGIAAFLAVAGSERIVPERRGPLRGALEDAACGLVWPSDARPASGWIGTQLIAEAVRHRRYPWLQTAAATAALGVSARSHGRDADPARLRENLIFPFLCSVLGAAIMRARRKLAEAEAETISLRQRAEFVESLTPATARFHDVLKPLKRSGMWLRHFDDDTGARLQALSEEFTTLTEALRQLITVPDPLADLQEHLLVRLAPIEVTVSGVQPVMEETRERKRLLDRARAFTELIRLADDIADQLLDEHPRDALGRSSLRLVHLHVEVDAEDHVVLHVEPYLAGAAERPVQHSGRSNLELSAHAQRHPLRIDAVARRLT